MKPLLFWTNGSSVSNQLLSGCLSSCLQHGLCRPQPVPRAGCALALAASTAPWGSLCLLFYQKYKISSVSLPVLLIKQKTVGWAKKKKKADEMQEDPSCCSSSIASLAWQGCWGNVSTASAAEQSAFSISSAQARRCCKPHRPTQLAAIQLSAGAREDRHRKSFDTGWGEESWGKAAEWAGVGAGCPPPASHSREHWSAGVARCRPSCCLLWHSSCDEPSAFPSLLINTNNSWLTLAPPARPRDCSL